MRFAPSTGSTPYPTVSRSLESARKRGRRRRRGRVLAKSRERDEGQDRDLDLHFPKERAAKVKGEFLHRVPLLNPHSTTPVPISFSGVKPNPISRVLTE